MENELRKKLSYNLRVERAKKALTQEKLAELASISTKHLTKIENENVTPSIYIVYKLAKALGVSVDKLISDETD
ncbi:MAG: helix-turn-helix transcriptional regulator [Candidatus Gastranaerophilales bacterium]|nr:helix-turn-helix transcriptional regulator [Candidatus Gastranaerophilales bacterium]